MKLESQLMRGAGPIAVLQMLSSRSMYGYELAEELDKQTAGVLHMGQSTLYPLLYNLEGKGLIKAEWQTAESGRRRKYYKLTPRGGKKLEADTQQWARLATAMASLGVFPMGASPATGGAG
jgi:PadR family transcriptional regulator PadR